MLELSTLATKPLTADCVNRINVFSQQCNEEKIFSLAESYEALIGESSAKKLAAFYTPLALVRRMVSEALAHFSTPPTTIADIACGSGIFLLEAFKQLISKFDLQPTKALSSIYGVDRDPSALSVAQVLLATYGAQKGSSSSASIETILTQLLHGNSLIGPEEVSQIKDFAQLQALDTFSWLDNFPTVFNTRQGFDLIIGNPPYGLSRSQRISPVETELLRKSYLGNHRGRINTYVLFILRSYALLAPQGVLSFVVPNAWLGIDEALTIRKLLIESRALTQIDTFIISPFKKLGVEVITFIIKKDSLATSLEIRTSNSMNDAKALKTEVLPFSKIMKDPSYRISLTTSLKRGALIEQIEGAGCALKSESALFKASIGLQAYGKGRGNPAQTSEVVASHPFHANQKQSAVSVPYLEGKDVRPFCIRWGGQYIEYGPWLAECPPLSRYTDARLIVREILGPKPRLFQAAVTYEPFVYNRSILQIHPLSDHGRHQLRALAAILNSSLAGFWLMQRGRKAQRRLFPKIVVHDLNDFPIVKLSLESITRLNALYDEIAHAQSADNQNQVNATLSILDEEVAKLYGVSKEELEAETHA
jgi:methylase of polypeptide subunit release factors